MPRSSCAALVAPVLAVALLAPGCSERADRRAVPADAPPADAPAAVVADDVLARLRAAGEIALDAGSARFVATLALEVRPHGDHDGDPVAVELVTTGAFSGRRLELSTDLGATIRSVDPHAPLPPGFDEPTRTILDGATTYLRLPALDELLGTTGWVVATPAEIATLDALPRGAASPGIGGVDPIALLEVLRDVGPVELVGEEEVGGVRATHLRAEADVAGALDLGPDAAPEVVPVDVWVDAAGLVHRLEVDLGEAPELLGPLGRLASGREGFGVAGSATMTLTLADHGADLEVALPRPDDVVPLAEVLAAVDGALARSGRGGR